MTQQEETVKHLASLWQRVAQQQSVQNMEDRNANAQTAADSGASEDVVKMLQTEDDGMVHDDPRVMCCTGGWHGLRLSKTS